MAPTSVVVRFPGLSNSIDLAIWLDALFSLAILLEATSTFVYAQACHQQSSHLLMFKLGIYWSRPSRSFALYNAQHSWSRWWQCKVRSCRDHGIRLPEPGTVRFLKRKERGSAVEAKYAQERVQKGINVRLHNLSGFFLPNRSRRVHIMCMV